LAFFVGQSLDQAREELSQRGEQGGVLYELSPYIRHQGEESDDTVDWTYVVQNGDTGLALVTTFHHPDCRDDIP
jgi:hypothetical protein